MIWYNPLSFDPSFTSQDGDSIVFAYYPYDNKDIKVINIIYVIVL